MSDRQKNGKKTEFKRDKLGHFQPGNTEGKPKGKKRKTLKREELRRYISEVFDVKEDNPLVDIMVEMSEAEDDKLRAKLVDMIMKRVSTKKSQKPVMSPLIQEFLDFKRRKFLDGRIIED